MAAVSIIPVQSSSLGGYPVTINGIDPTDHDCIIGEITTPGMGIIQARWNLNGTMRGGEDKTNLDMRSPELSDVAQTAQKLGAEP